MGNAGGKARGARVGVLILVIALGAGGLFCLALAVGPYSFARGVFDLLAPDGRADFYTVPAARMLSPAFALLGLALLAAAGALIVFRQGAESGLATLAAGIFGAVLVLWRAQLCWVRNENRLHLAALTGVIFVAVVLRVAFLFQPIRADEAYTYTRYASQPLHVALSTYHNPNNHLLHTLLVHYSCRWLGNAPWAIRMPALICGLLLVPAVYLLLRVFYEKHAALLGAALVAASSPLILYSTNARGYTLFCLIFVALVLVAIRLLRGANVWWWVGFALLAAAGFYAIPIMLYALGGVVLWLVAAWATTAAGARDPRLPRRLVVSLAGTAVLTALLYLPVFLRAGVRAVVSPAQPWAHFVRTFPPSLAATWAQWHMDVPAWLAALLAVGAIMSLIWHRRIAAIRLPLLSGVLAWCLPVVGLQRVTPFPRVWLFVLPLYLGLAVAGVGHICSRIEAKRPGWGCFLSSAAGILLVLYLGTNALLRQSIYYSEETGTFRDGEVVTAFLKGNLGRDDRVLVLPPADGVLTYHFTVERMPLTLLNSDLDTASRIVVVTCKPERQSLEEVTAAAGLNLADFAMPRLLRRYPLAELYEITRRRPGSLP